MSPKTASFAARVPFVSPATGTPTPEALRWLKQVKRRGDAAARIPQTIVAGASPYDYTAPSDGFIVIDPTTVTALDYVRDSAITSLPPTTTLLPVSQGDTVRVSWVGTAPAITTIPS